MPILLGNLWSSPSACAQVSPVLVRPLVWGSGIGNRSIILLSIFSQLIIIFIPNIIFDIFQEPSASFCIFRGAIVVTLWHLWVSVLERFCRQDIVEFLGHPICLIWWFTHEFFSPLACWPKLETKQEQSNIMWLVFQIWQSSKVKISQATVLTKIHPHTGTTFFLMDAEGVLWAGLGQQGNL